MVTTGNGPYHQRRVEDMVVKRKIIGGNEANARILLRFPVLVTDFAGNFLQCIAVDCTRPELLVGFFKLTEAPHARVAEVV
ncbi:hypothetical protein D3C87_1983480 [compost metagenome]